MIKSITEIPNLLSKFDNNTLIFRGQTNKNWKLEPKLFREKNDLRYAKKYELASYHPFLHEKTKFYKIYNSPIENLINLQHFGCATRLLDFTSNPYIALFFACYDPEENNINENGKIFTILKSYFHVYKNEKCELSDYKKMKNEITSLFESDKFYFIDPLFKNNRMVNQNGSFLLFPLLPINENELNKPIDFDSYVRGENIYAKENLDLDKPFWYAHIEVDKNYKKSILNELDTNFGINENFIYTKDSNLKNIENHFKEIIIEIEEVYKNFC